jgi:hypothetical protein
MNFKWDYPALKVFVQDGKLVERPEDTTAPGVAEAA